MLHHTGLLVMLMIAVAPLAPGGGVSVKRLVGLRYPPIATQAQIQGDVKVFCKIGADGKVEGTEAVSGHPILAKAARENASQWLFEVPAGNPPQEWTFALTHRFRLEGECEAPSCTSTFVFEYPDSITVLSPAPHWNPSQAPE